MLDRRFPDWIHLVFNFVPGEGLSEGDTSQQDQTKCGTLMDMINLNPLVLPSVAASTAFQGKLCGSGVAALTTIRASLRSITCSVYRSLDYFQPAFALTVELKTALWQPLTAHYDLNTHDFAGALSHMYGTSTANQRIESWWSFFRKQRTQFWIELFSDLRERHLFNGSHEHKCLLRYVFLGILQKDLDEYRQLWNNHTIRPVRLSQCPSGLAEGSVDFQCPGKPYTTLMASCKHHPSTICVVMRIWRCILWTCKDGVGWLHQ
ncbi:uncharacterized protein LOC117538527 isoform X2 [Gymnodraco acuticeps]|uniref:Uncharacterized protein LOC117538527 isoform X2 n=1 Tax=Gymnodraco acuticeps TaxID=8218 RepID=A0A6P8TQ04_GYMAC|nr:uncharacterized protein LOC117538527 isoform X2 [Gymnodraco acuticeps]